MCRIQEASFLPGPVIHGAHAKVQMAAAVLAMILPACHGLPQKSTPPPGRAMAPVANPAFAAGGNGHATRPGRFSGVSRVESGPEAFAARVAMARFAKQSLDIQYYIWDGDQTGSYLLGELLTAADRGVRVRLLLDDVSSDGIIDGLVGQLASGMRAFASDVEDGLARVTPQTLQRRDRMRNLMKQIHTGGRDLVAAALDTHPNIEVRMFNPIPSRKLGGITRTFQLIADFSRLNRRMHNKIFAADNQIAIVGGRNIADKYFGLDRKLNWRDLDLLVRGPVVRDVTGNFDLYWNSQWAVPVRAFTAKWRSGQRLTDLRNELGVVFTGKTDPTQQHLDQDSAALSALHRLNARMVQAPVSVVADVPEKFSGSGEPLVAQALGELADRSRKEILIESAYFVPDDRTFSRMEQRLADGVAIQTLTNSLASTNQVAAHAGYVKHRKDLLRSGVAMHELCSFKGGPSPFGFLTHSGRAGLHTKAVVFDRQEVFVGTFNLDPRSAELNTEIGLVVQSPQLGEEVARFIKEGMEPDRSWRVNLRPAEKPGQPRESMRLYWWRGDPEKPVTTRHEPEARLGTRMLMRILSWLPIEGLL